MTGRGWLIWFSLSFGTFLFFETRALLRRRTQDTLSGAIWRFERFRTGQPLYQWSAGHVLFVGVLAVAFTWLLFHFALGWWK